MLRSLLFVPGDRGDRFEKAVSVGADALILDLEDAVDASRKSVARSTVAEFLSRTPRTIPLFVRVNALDSGLIDADLAAIVPRRPDGIVLPKADGEQSLLELDSRLFMMGDTAIAILPIAAETAASIFTLGRYGGVTPRLCGLTWGAEDCAAAVGTTSARDAEGRFRAPLEIARTLVLFGARTACVQAIDTVYAAHKDLEGLQDYAARSRADGFTGMMAIHPAQVGAINAAFTADSDDLDYARRVVALFDQNKGRGALVLDGKMVDAVHLKHAVRVVANSVPKR